MGLKERLLAASIALACVACESADPKVLIKEGYSALNKGHSDEAHSKFEAALKSLQPTDAQYKDARLGAAEALIAGQPKLAVDEFMKLSVEMPEKIGVQDFVYLSEKMIGAGKYMEAIDLIENGMKRLGGKPPTLVAQIDHIKKKAANEQAVILRIKGLGY